MLLALQNAISTLLKSALPSLFSGSAGATATFSGDIWDFDRLSADPIAGEPGPEDAVDELAFDPLAPAGPYSLTRPPHPGPKRVYLRSTRGELVALRSAEVAWNPDDPAAFSVVPGAARDLSGYNRLHVMYGVVAAATRLRSQHTLTLGIAGADAESAEKAFALALAVLVMNREGLVRGASFSWSAGDYQVEGSVKALKFSSGSSPGPALRTLALEVEVDLRVDRMLTEGEGRPMARILAAGEGTGSDAAEPL